MEGVRVDEGRAVGGVQSDDGDREVAAPVGDDVPQVVGVDGADGGVRVVVRRGR
ncbi:hypothetical protein [Bifidobacterium samirii]|uniref:hypothetical protein n=1 Tax=Bifidobacterium samirii TaxID=2306974 RepID=UPI0013E07E5D|nr:hypothetical protein [Bifidobacterium samirii]